MTDQHNNSLPIIKAASACVWRGNEVLLVQRGKALGHGLWMLPGGKREAGETPQQAAERELLEETGLSVLLPTHVGLFSVHLDGGRFEIDCFTGLWTSGEAMAASDSMAVRWVHWQNLDTWNVSYGNDTAILRARTLLKL